LGVSLFHFNILNQMFNNSIDDLQFFHYLKIKWYFTSFIRFNNLFLLLYWFLFLFIFIVTSFFLIFLLFHLTNSFYVLMNLLFIYQKHISLELIFVFNYLIMIILIQRYFEFWILHLFNWMLDPNYWKYHIELIFFIFLFYQ